MAVPQEELCSTHDETESSCTAQASKYDSASTLGILSTIWSTIQKAEGPSSDKDGTSEPGYTSTKSNEETIVTLSPATASVKKFPLSIQERKSSHRPLFPEYQPLQLIPDQQGYTVI